MIRGAVLGATGALGLASQTDSLDGLPSSLFQGSLNAYDALSRRHSPNTQSNENLDKLAANIAELKALQAASNGKQVVIYGSSSGGYYKIAILTSTGVLVLYYFGYSFSDIMYVTKAALSKAVDALETKINHVGTKIEQTKNQLLAKVASVESTVEMTADMLEAKIQGTSTEIRFDLSQLDAKFVKLQNGQDKMVLTAEALDAHISELEAKFKENSVQLSKANEGIELLVRGVESLPHMRSDIVTDLRKYLSKGKSLFWGASSQNQSQAEIPRELEKKTVPSFVNMIGST